MQSVSIEMLASCTSSFFFCFVYLSSWIQDIISMRNFIQHGQISLNETSKSKREDSAWTHSSINGWLESNEWTASLAMFWPSNQMGNGLQTNRLVFNVDRGWSIGCWTHILLDDLSNGSNKAGSFFIVTVMLTN